MSVKVFGIITDSIHRSYTLKGIKNFVIIIGMQRFKKLILSIWCVLFGVQLGITQAQEFSGVIPKASSVESNSELQCLLEKRNEKSGEIEFTPNNFTPADGEKADIGAKIYCGTVSLNDIPQLIVYLIQWLMTLVGGICVIMIMIGGVQYMIGGVTDDKEQGKKTVIYALGGLITSMFAWIIVELIQVWLTA